LRTESFRRSALPLIVAKCTNSVASAQTTRHVGQVANLLFGTGNAKRRDLHDRWFNNASELDLQLSATTRETMRGLKN